ncbi:MAG: TolC family protein [Gemmatimonadetes bacterium]|nr:TolC family protein [Gemmatimonadota bacterium]
MPSPPDTIVLTLREAGRLALEREPGLQADRQGAAIARGEYRQSRLDGLNPAIDFQQYETGALGGTQAYTVGLSLELPWAGQRGLRIAAARAGMERANATTADAVRLAEATVSLAFFGAVAAERRLQLAEQMAAASQRFFDLTRIQLREGEISALEANLTDIEFRAQQGASPGGASRRDGRAARTAPIDRCLLGDTDPARRRGVVGTDGGPPQRRLPDRGGVGNTPRSRGRASAAGAVRLVASACRPGSNSHSAAQRVQPAGCWGTGLTFRARDLGAAPRRRSGPRPVDQEEARVAQARSRVAALELAVGAKSPRPIAPCKRRPKKSRRWSPLCWGPPDGTSPWWTLPIKPESLRSQRCS